MAANAGSPRVKPVNKSLSLLAALGRLVDATIGAVSLPILTLALEVSTNAAGSESLRAFALPLISTYNIGASVGIVFFGFHLLVLGYLVFRSNYMPRVIGALLMIVSTAHLVDNLGKLLLPNYGSTIVPSLVILPAFLREFSLMVWLLWKGWKLPQDARM